MFDKSILWSKAKVTAGPSFEDKRNIWMIYCQQSSCFRTQLPRVDQPGASDGSLRTRMFLITDLSFCLRRVKLKEGVTFLGARPSNPTQWIVSQDVRSEGHRVVTLHCRRKESGYDQQRSARVLCVSTTTFVSPQCVLCFFWQTDVKMFKCNSRFLAVSWAAQQAVHDKYCCT